MRILVVGAGAIGCLVGGRLAFADHEVTLVTRRRLAGTIADSGLRLNVSGETIYVPSLPAVTTVKEAIFEFGPFDLILFTMKSYDTEAGIRDVQSATDQVPAVLSLQNGVGNEQLLAAAFGRESVMAGVITAPAEMPLPGVIRATRGAIGLAALDPKLPLHPVENAFRSAEFETRVYADWRGLKWSKLLLNVLGNATSAILDWPPEQVFGHPTTFDLEWRAWREARRVIRAQDVRIVSLPHYPLPLIVRVTGWLPKFLLRPVMARAVAGGRGGKMPSLHADLEQGKPRSEVTVLNGAVVEAGQRLGVPTPVNAAIAGTLMDIVRGEVDWDAFRGRPERLLVAVDTMRQEQTNRVNG